MLLYFYYTSIKAKIWLFYRFLHHNDLIRSDSDSLFLRNIKRVPILICNPSICQRRNFIFMTALVSHHSGSAVSSISSQISLRNFCKKFINMFYLYVIKMYLINYFSRYLLSIKYRVFLRSCWSTSKVSSKSDHYVIQLQQEI